VVSIRPRLSRVTDAADGDRRQPRCGCGACREAQYRPVGRRDVARLAEARQLGLEGGRKALIVQFCVLVRSPPETLPLL
jgi:hypothetical protein